MDLASLWVLENQVYVRDNKLLLQQEPSCPVGTAWGGRQEVQRLTCALFLSPENES